MERLTNKREADAQREEYEHRLANGYPRNIPEERFLRLAAYEDTGLTPAEVSALVKDWSDLCTIVGGCVGIDRLRELAEADKEGRLTVLPVRPVLTQSIGSMLYIINGDKDYSPDMGKGYPIFLPLSCGGTCKDFRRRRVLSHD